MVSSKTLDRMNLCSNATSVRMQRAGQEVRERAARAKAASAWELSRPRAHRDPIDLSKSLDPIDLSSASRGRARRAGQQARERAASEQRQTARTRELAAMDRPVFAHKQCAHKVCTPVSALRSGIVLSSGLF